MCTRVLWADAGGAVLVGRTMDWMQDTGTNVWAFPRGLSRDDGLGGELTWSSRYASLVASAEDLMTVDGFNEAGLAAHQLFLPESHYGDPGAEEIALSLAVWLQFFLDTFDTVAAAVAWVRDSQLRIVAQSDPISGREITLHLALEDRSGDSAIIEYLDGRPVIHHGRAYTVVTNSPPFDEQLRRLARIEGLGGTEPLPGGTDADHRFARAAFYLNRLPTPADTSEAIASILSVMRNTAQPFRIPDLDKPYASQTQWLTVIDLTHGIYVYQSMHRPNIVWARLDGLDLSEGAPPRRLDLTHDHGLEGGLVGDVTADFAEAESMRFIPAR